MSETQPRLSDVLRVATSAALADTWTSLPGVVQSYDATKQRANVKPALRRGYVDENGERQTDEYPVITDVAVICIGGGQYAQSFPVTKGDTGLLLFCSRSIDKWLVTGKLADGLDDRKHAMSDAVLIVGLRPFSQALSEAGSEFAWIGHVTGSKIEFHPSEIRVGGSAQLATKADIDALAAMIGSHFHTFPAVAGSPTSTPVQVTPAANGTQITKGA